MRYGTEVAATYTPEDYFEAGLEVLAGSGPQAVTVAALCRRLGVTKGSFYHHFSGIPDFMQRVLGHWERQEVRRALEAWARAERDKPTEIAKLAATWGIRHEAETAIRALARTDASAAEVLQRVDDRREHQLAGLFEMLGMEEGRARVLARVGMAILIGTQQREHPVDRRRLEQMLGEYQQWVEQAASGGRPEPAGRAALGPARRSR